MKIKVTQQNIDDGTDSNGYNCPIAKAFRDIWPNLTIFVALGRVKVGHLCCALPQEAKSFILKYDQGDAVEPFEFELVENWYRVF